MATTTSTTYGMTDLVPDASTLTNSGIPTTCPMCGEESLTVWHHPPLGYPLGRCGECEWMGHPVHLRVEQTHNPYSVASASYESYGPDIKASRDLPDQMRTLQGILDESRKIMVEHMREIAPHYQKAFGYDPDRTQAMSRHIGCIPPDMSEELAGEKSEDVLFVIPYYLTGGFLVQLGYYNSGGVRRATLTDNEHDPSGALDLSSGDGPVMMFSDPSRAAGLADAYQVSSLDEDWAPVLLVRSHRHLCWPHMNTDRRIVVQVDDLDQGLISTFHASDRVRYTTKTVDEMRSELEYGTVGFRKRLWERSMTFSEVVSMAFESDHRGIIRSISRASVSDSQLHRIASRSTPHIRNKMRERWPKLRRSPVVSVGGTTYYRIEEGGYVTYSPNNDGTTDQKRVANVDFRLTERILAPDRTLCRGWVTHAGSSVTAELESPYGSTLIERLTRAMRDLQLSSTPDFSLNPREWMRLNQSASDPPTYTGREECMWADGVGVLLPGVTINRKHVENVGRIAREGCDFLEYTPIDPGSTAWGPGNEQDMGLLVACTVGILLTTHLMGEKTGSMYVIAGEVAPLVHTLCTEWGLDRDVEGYPHLSSRSDPMSVNILEEPPQSFADRAHTVLVPSVEDYSDPQMGMSLVFETLQEVLRGDFSEDSCSCEVFLSAADKVGENHGFGCISDRVRQDICCHQSAK